jgi:hypothetical protein
MNPLSKITASALAGIQDTTLALANINFDFTLYKVEAPKEYQGLRKQLSSQRVEAAEHGTEHIVARKLGALFSQCMPSTPNLIKAYGLRCSEIAASSAHNPHGSPDDGIFEHWIGADATSIWAAATSGQAAISVHLLACMLARIWSASEAIAIWEEIIEVRKKELIDLDPAEPIHITALSAARVELSREQISRWDDSARAWLSIADGAKRKQQTQLMLVIDKFKLSVNQSMKVYASVMESWKSALLTLDKMIVGMPHSVQDGAVLLGLSSWHLYPEMHVLGATPPNISQNDRLMHPGGLLTLGMVNHLRDTGEGVFWSLPLAYLRFYGDPVTSLRTIGETSTRLTISEFFLVILGAIFAGWAKNGNDLKTAAQLVVAMSDYIVLNRQATSRRATTWLQYLAEAACTFLTSEGTVRQYQESLIARGKRRHGAFLAEPLAQPAPMFGVATIKDLLFLITDEEKRVQMLRFVAQSLCARPDSLLIRYRTCRHVSRSTENGLSSALDNFLIRREVDNGEPEIEEQWGYASALRAGDNVRKRKHMPSSNFDGYTRWIDDPEAFENLSLRGTGETIQNLDLVEALEQNSTSFRWNTQSAPFTNMRSTPSQSSLYECIVGDPAVAAIFKRSDAYVTGSEELDCPTFTTALSNHWTDPDKFVQQIDGGLDRPYASQPHAYMRSLRALAAAADVYKLMPNATITTGVFSNPLGDPLWVLGKFNDANLSILDTKVGDDDKDTIRTQVAAPQLFGTTIDPRVLIQKAPTSQEEREIEIEPSADYPRSLSTRTLNRAETFACIAMFENRNVNLDPQALGKVMAISTGNSIFVAMPLVCDPSDRPLANEIKRVVGNIGKSGISLLIPPIVPKVRKVEEDTWHQVNHAQFNGVFEDCFQHTSLHLSFTGYTLPFSVASHGAQAVEASFVEALVSVFDRSEWVADLDILGAIQSPFLSWGNETLRCRHKSRQGIPKFPVTSIDSWHEFFDPPQNSAIFRAKNNWNARLSAATLCAQQGKKALLFRDETCICWQCLMKMCCCSKDELLPQHAATLFIC